jgi:hypothetical protein
MKTLVSIISITAAVSLLGSGPLRGQDAVEASQAEAERAQAKAQQQIQELHQLVQASASTGGGASAGVSGPAFVDRLQTIIRRAPGASGRALIIRSTDTDPKTQANLEEDLAVMSRIFDKALAEKLGKQQSARTAMGINVYFTPGTSPIRSLYLDGYGALFMLNAGFPLLSPPARPEPQKEETPTGSTWEEAKRELYGQPAEARVAAGPVEEYDESKVNQLKDALLEALKSATNIRNLKSDDSVTVCVFGGAGAAPVRTRTSSTVRVVRMNGGAAPPPGYTASGTATLPPGYTAAPNEQWVMAGGDNGAPARGTIMTIRVKKSDVDAFAKGRLNLDEFRKKASITAYAGNVSAGNGSVQF